MFDKLSESISNGVKNLQDKPDHIKQRILLGTSTVAVVIVVGLWFMGFKHDIQNISGADILNTGNASQPSAPHYTKIENAEQTDGRTLIYFSIKNDTQDILSAPTLADITAVIDGKNYAPTKLSDRQGKDFDKKVLSNSESFGILTFETLPKKSGNFTFDNMYFEQSPNTIFKETLNTDISKLSPPEPIRN